MGLAEAASAKMAKEEDAGGDAAPAGAGPPAGEAPQLGAGPVVAAVAIAVLLGSDYLGLDLFGSKGQAAKGPGIAGVGEAEGGAAEAAYTDITAELGADPADLAGADAFSQGGKMHVSFCSS